MSGSDYPTVKVLFTGLVILRFLKDKPHCEIYLHRVSSDHVPSITLKKKEKERPDIILWKYYGHLPDELWLDVVNMERRIEVYKHGRTLNRSNPKSSLQERDIRWAINLESEDFHNCPIAIRPEGVGFGMYMTKGRFYTEARTSPTEFQIVRKDGGKQDLPFYSVASVIGADIFFDKDDSAVILHWGRDEKHMLRLEKEEGVSYEIAVDNSPAVEVTSRTSYEMHSELKRYYQVLSGIAPGERFDLVFGDGPISPDVPCMCLVLGSPK
jgi:hypothetical protein